MDMAFLILRGQLRYWRPLDIGFSRTVTDSVDPGASYTMHGENSESVQKHIREVVSGDWVSEIAMWMEWCHLGTLEGTAATELLALSAHGLHQVLKNHPLVAEVTMQWCQAFAAQTQNVDSRAMVELELVAPFGALIGAMPKGTRQLMGQNAIQMLQKHLGVSGKLINRGKLDELEQEVMHGISVVAVDGN
eukprot:4811563-Amphidinium_carterae.1